MGLSAVELLNLHDILYDIQKNKKLVIYSPYSNFNAVLSLWFFKLLVEEGRKPCIHTDDVHIEYVVNDLCREKYPEIHICVNALKSHDCVINITNSFSKCAGDIDVNNCCVICIANDWRPVYNRMHGTIYQIKRVGSNLYRVLRVENGKAKGYALLKMQVCEVFQYEMPSDLRIIYEELSEIVNEFGSIKATDFLKYITRKRNMDREHALNMIRLAISMGIIKYSNGHLTIY